jgi:hypothetical protein
MTTTPGTAKTAAQTGAPAGAQESPIAERVAKLRELAQTDPARAQDSTWEWFRELGAARDADSLEELFSLGTAPGELNGPTEGILVVPFIQGAFDRFAGLLTRFWMPWQGKSFDPANAKGVNRLTNSARWPSKLLWPRYSTKEAPDGRLAFEFETNVEPGKIEPAVDVLKIDYEPVESNPNLVIRKIRDELVQITPDTHLGRILYKGGDGYKNIGYFALKQPTG